MSCAGKSRAAHGPLSRLCGRDETRTAGFCQTGCQSSGKHFHGDIREPKISNRTNGARRQVQGGRRRFNGGQQYERIQLPFRGGYDGFVRPRESIDINPEQNPFVKGAVTEPPKGKAFDRPSKRQSAHSRGQPGISCRVMSLLRPSSGRAGSGVEIGAARRTISTSRRTAASR